MAVPDEPPERYFAFRDEDTCTLRNPPEQFIHYYPRLRDVTHWRRLGGRVKHDLEVTSAQCGRPWLPPELHALRYAELDDVIELEQRQAATAHAPPIVAAQEAAYFFITSLPAGIQGPRIPYWEDPFLVVGWCAHPCADGGRCVGKSRRCLRPIIIGASKPHVQVTGAIPCYTRRAPSERRRLSTSRPTARTAGDLRLTRRLRRRSLLNSYGF